MVGTKATIVRTPILHGCVPVPGHLWCFDENFAAAAVIIDIIGYQHAPKAMFRATLQHINVIVLKTRSSRPLDENMWRRVRPQCHLTRSRTDEVCRAEQLDSEERSAKV